MSKQKYIHFFGSIRTDGNKEMKNLLGGKGANLAEMTSIGLPVPPGFTIDTEACSKFFEIGGRLPEGLMDGVQTNIALLEKEIGKKFGDEKNPLLISVRSGAPVSMPGMMDTVLNLGLTDETLGGLSDSTANRRFALDAYRRLIDMYGNVVKDISHEHFENVFNRIKKKYGVSLDTDLEENGLSELIEAYKSVYKKYSKAEFPQDPIKQLEFAIVAVFESWITPRANEYRRINNITSLLGTAVNIQSMVFGNMGNDSGTGVTFTRNPSTGENEFYGEFLVNAQGEDVVAGIRTPQPISEMMLWKQDLYQDLVRIKDILEQHYCDLQDIEFTIECGKLYILQTRSGKRTGKAAVKIAVDLVNENCIDKKTALLRVSAKDLNQLLLPSFDPNAVREVLTSGLPVSPGAATGRLAFTADEAVKRVSNGEKVILLRRETSPEDIHGMHVAEGILTATGGTTSHASVVARGWGKCCVSGAINMEIDADKKMVVINGRSFSGDDILSIDGSTGEVILGELPLVEPEFCSDFKTIMKWADEARNLRVMANADSPEDAKRARELGAEGIGLCRTEHMFFDPDRIITMRQMIIADNVSDRHNALDSLLPCQRQDFEEIFTVMHDLPVIIRLLDPPLHEFLPHDLKSQTELASELGISLKQIQIRVNQLHEVNPMLGHRGCRLAISYPEILEMQVTAITEAMINCQRNNINARPEIMIPLTGTDTEIKFLRNKVNLAIEQTKKLKRFKEPLNILIGTMIEVPRAALCADQIAQSADFFSFGTNDLTQMTLGYSRDDVNTFLPNYLEQEILTHSPFETIDQVGVGKLVEMAVINGRNSKPGLTCGICGEHGGDSESIKFFNRIGLDYVSCSPFSLPIARLAAAQSVIERTEVDLLNIDTSSKNKLLYV